MTTVIWWTRRDLRLSDNQVLAAALAHGERVIPVFVLDPALLDSSEAGENRAAFLFGGLRQLDADLRARGSLLVVRRGDALCELRALMDETGATAIFAEEDYSPCARECDARLAAALPLRLSDGVTVHRPGAVLKADGTPYTVFTPFSRAWKALPLPMERDLLLAPGYLPSVPGLEDMTSCEIPDSAQSASFPAGEPEALRRLETFAASGDPPIYRYSQRRNRLDLDGTSRLSPYLRFGMVSARQAVSAALTATGTASGEVDREGAETWLDELIWREFFNHILYHFPQVLESSFRSQYDRIEWDDDEALFDAWCEGRTGYPIVDASMRQLARTGWMHNRGRMIVASFLVKDLLIDWRWGERFFMQHLLDGDPAANNGGWQWTAGTGTDATPYFRVFNPVLQGKKHDPDGVFVRRWLPQLERVPDKFVHVPWEMPKDAQRDAGCVIGLDYPAPVVDHAWARERALAAYARARELSK